MNDSIEILQKQIVKLQEELAMEKRKKESLWHSIYSSLRNKGLLSKKSSDLSHEITKCISEWVFSQRSKLEAKVYNGRIPLYTDCLNDLLASLSSPESASGPAKVEPLGDLTVGELDSTIPEPPENPLPEVPNERRNMDEIPMEKINPFSKRVNVPKQRNQQ